MSNPDGTLDITNAVEEGRAALSAWSVDWFYLKIATIPAIGGFLVAALKFFKIGEWLFEDFTKQTVMVGMMGNTILRKPAQATEFVDAAHKLNNIPPEATDDEVEALERNKGQYFKNLVRLTN